MSLVIAKPTGGKLAVKKPTGSGWTITPQTKVPVDPFRSQVSLLLHGDGVNGSTTITDNSPTPKTVTAVGNAQISTAQSKFGGSSIAFDGNGDGLFVAAGNQEFNLSSGNWTVEVWVYFNTFSINTDPHVFQISTDAANRYVVYRDASTGKLSFVTVNNNIFTFSNSTTSPTPNTWYHVAISRLGTTSTLFINGVAEATNSQPINSGTLLEIGFISINTPNQFRLNGYIDDLRITKGVARYTANFTPPAAPFPDI